MAEPGRDAPTETPLPLAPESETGTSGVEPPHRPQTPPRTDPATPAPRGRSPRPASREVGARTAAARLRRTALPPATTDTSHTPEAPDTTGPPSASGPSGSPADSRGARGRTARPTARAGEDGPPSGYVTAEMIAERLARITGKPSIPASTIRGMASREQLPAPTDRKWGRRTLWDAAQIDRWLQEREARHVSEPTVRQIQRRLTELDEHARRTGNDLRLKEGVREAHRRGLSYQQIADAIRAKNGDHHPTREAVRVRFRHYLGQGPTTSTP